MRANLWILAVFFAIPVHAADYDIPPVVDQALRLVGVPYMYGGTGDVLDCSAFTQTVYCGIGVRIPRTSREQFGCGYPVSLRHGKPGDLLFYRGPKGVISHVALYLGNGYLAHATSRYGRTVVEPVAAVNRRHSYAGARRILSESESLAPQPRPEPKEFRSDPSGDPRSLRKAHRARARSFLTAILRMGK